MKQDLEILLSLKNNNTKFYDYLLYLVNVYDEAKIYEFLEKNNIQYSLLKLKLLALQKIKFLYSDVVEQKEFTCEDSYKKILKCYSDLANNLGLSTPLEMCIFFNKLLYMGYLSKYKYLKYDADGYDDFFGPYIVLSGKGCCRNFSILLKDFLDQNKIDSRLYVNYITDPSNSLIETIIGNHMCVVVRENCFSYIYDPTNENPIIYKGLNRYKSLDGKCTFYNRSEFINDYSVVDKNNVDEFKKYYENSLAKVNNIIDKNIAVIDKTHHDIQSYFSDVCEYLITAKKGYERTRMK